MKFLSKQKWLKSSGVVILAVVLIAATLYLQLLATKIGRQWEKFTQLAAPAQAASTLPSPSLGATPNLQLPNFRHLAEKLIPAVVSLQVEQKIKIARPYGRGLQDPFEFFQRYFGGEIPQEFHNRGLGTGFLIDSQGLILTNNHVVENAETIEVGLVAADGSERKLMAKVVGSAPDYDVALLKTTEPAAAPIATLGNSDEIYIGDWVMAVGNPFGLTHSVSVGIISAKDRRNIAPSGRLGLYDFLQTDASINPGNSGGPLVNLAGEVIGINTAINAEGSGIGFAIPINIVKAILGDLKTKGKYTRSWLGIKMQPLTPELAATYGFKGVNGALVVDVIPDGPAAAAKLQEGDIIFQFDGRDIHNYNDLQLLASMKGVDQKVSLKYWRNGREQLAWVKLKKYPQDKGLLGRYNGEDEDESPEEEGRDKLPKSESRATSLGIVVVDLNGAWQRELGLDNNLQGVLIRAIEPASLLARLGVRAGDVILEVNGTRVVKARKFVDMVNEVKSGGLLRFKLWRQGGSFFLGLRKP